MAARKSALREYAEAVALALVLALLVRSFVVQAFKIPSGSMLPTLQVGDHLLVNKLRYGVPLPLAGGWLIAYSFPQPGDVVVFGHPAKRRRDFIKRVIAVQGETIEIRGKQVFVNGVRRDSPYAYFADGPSVPSGHERDSFPPHTIPPGKLFVMGDNRDRSSDSRHWGFVDFDSVKGRAEIIYWSWDNQERWVRWERIASLVY